jgi:hypothetical protein
VNVNGYIKALSNLDLPIRDVECLANPSDLGYRVQFFIGDTQFAAFIASKDIHRASADSRALALVVGAPFVELRRILDEAEQRGAVLQEQSILGQINGAIGTIVGRLDRAERVFRRLRRFGRFLRRTAK